MKRFLIALVLPLFLACGGGGSSAPAPAPKPAAGFTLKTSVTPKPKAMDLMAALDLSPQVAVDPSTLAFEFGITANEGGTLVAGYSGDSVVATAATVPPVFFNVSTTINGVTVGANGVSQTFAPTDPSIVYGASTLTGPATFSGGGSLGLFMAQFASTNSTTINVTLASTNTIPKVNELVLRVSQAQQPIADANKNQAYILASPHFIAGTTLYADDGNNGIETLTVTNKTTPPSAPLPNNSIGNVQYILFAPASVIGLNSSALVPGPTSVTDPVTNDIPATMNTATALQGVWPNTPVSTWIPKDTTAWINDPKCAGLKAAIDGFIANWPTTQGAAPTEATLAAYFQAYFIKFYAASSTLFSNPGISGSSNGNVLDPNSLGNLGDNTSASFEIIALDDITSGPMTLTGTSTLNLIYDPSLSVFDLNNGVLNLTGQPPIKFLTSITN